MAAMGAGSQSTSGAQCNSHEPARTLRTEGVADYLRARGVVPRRVAAQAWALAGGISNHVWRVEWAGGAVVVKQSLPLLRVAEVWEFDPRRILVECECMQVLGDLLPHDAVPQVIDVDGERLAFTMSCAPDGGEVWKDTLLRGDVDVVVAARAGELLATVHRESAGEPRLAARFDDLMPLIEGRIDPYHRSAARVHPDLAHLIDADVERLTTRRRALVLGDYSPKNLIAYPDHVLALDFEVAHWGDPAFDTAFMLTHLIAKAVHRRGECSDAYLSAAHAFWRTYRAHAGNPGATEADTVTELGVLLLCRVDGKSKLEYLSSDDRELIRAIARASIGSRERELGRLLDLVASHLGDRAAAGPIA
jgi:aminoglycoside phosphotransferase (APT) family kinase protein